MQGTCVNIASRLILAGALGLLLVYLVGLGSTESAVLWLDAHVWHEGQVWRLWSHVFVHRDLWHLGVNGLGLAALLGLWPQLRHRWGVWLALWLAYGLLTSVHRGGVVFGLSGVLHAAFAYAAWSWPFSPIHPGRQRTLLLAGLGLKLTAEALGWLDMGGIAWRLHIIGAMAGSGLALVHLGVRGLALPSARPEGRSILSSGKASR